MSAANFPLLVLAGIAMFWVGGQEVGRHGQLFDWITFGTGVYFWVLGVWDVILESLE